MDQERALSFLFQMLTSRAWCGVWEGLFPSPISETPFFSSIDGESWREGEVRRKFSLRSWSRWAMISLAEEWGSRPRGAGQQERGCRRACCGLWLLREWGKLDSLQPVFCFTPLPACSSHIYLCYFCPPFLYSSILLSPGPTPQEVLSQ